MAFFFSLITSCSFLGCGGNFHKRCAYKIPNNCNGLGHRTSAVALNAAPHSNTLPRPASQVGGWNDSSFLIQQSSSFYDSIPSSRDRRATWSGRPIWIDRAISGRIQIPHTFAVHSYKKPTVCQICKRLVGTYEYMTCV